MERTNDNRKKAWIPILMALSQIVLSIFVVYWLIEQFTEEKKILRKELISQYYNSQEQVIDSLLLKHVVNPALGDSMKFSVKLNPDSSRLFINHDSLNHTYTTYYKNNKPWEKKLIAINVHDVPNSHVSKLDTVNFLKIRKEDVLRRSIKMIVHQTEQSDLMDESSQLVFPLPIDDDLFKKIFSESLNQNKLYFGLNWYTKSDSNIAMKTGLLINNDFVDNLPAVSINKYLPYLFGKIWPQMVFAFFLIGLSASAFLFTYKSLKQQMQLNTLRNEFISNITHELKTPVSTAKVAIEALRTFDMKKDAKVAEKYLEMVAVEMNRLDNLTSKVLNHSKLESRAEIINKEKTNLSEFVSKVLLSMQAQFSQFNAEVFSHEMQESLVVEIDRFYIEGVLINLLDNSMKYAAPNPQIEVKANEKSDAILLSVSDNGPGIPKEYLPKVFDKFFRVPTDNKHNVKGYGLGLSFASMVMKQHKGEICVENLEKGGCRFTLKFPK